MTDLKKHTYFLKSLTDRFGTKGLTNFKEVTDTLAVHGGVEGELAVLLTRSHLGEIAMPSGSPAQVHDWYVTMIFQWCLVDGWKCKWPK